MDSLSLRSNSIEMKPQRNDPCHCGSGKKYKKCCLAKDEAEAREVRPVVVEDDPTVEALPVSDDAAIKWPATSPEEPTEEPTDEEHLLEDDAGPTEDEESSSEASDDTPEVDFPEVDDTLPELAPAEQQLVDQWWSELEPFYGSKGVDADEVVRRILAFAEEHPALFAHLGLDDEVIFEAGAELGRRQRWGEYIELLIRLRREQPRMYERNFGYYDYDIIGELIVRGCLSEVPTYLSLFKHYPYSGEEQACELADLLAWCGLKEALRELVAAGTYPVQESPKVISGGRDPRWLRFLEYEPFLTARDSSPEGGRRLAEALASIRISYEPVPEPDWLASQLRLASEPITAPLDLRGLGTKSRDYHDLGWRFRGFLHHAKGFPWVRAHFLADAFVRYCYWSADQKKKLADIREVKKDLLDHYLVRMCRNMFWLDATRACATLQAAVFFADFMEAIQTWNADKAEHVRRGCAELFPTIAPAVDATQPAVRLYPTFETLRKG